MTFRFFQDRTSARNHSRTRLRAEKAGEVDHCGISFGGPTILQRHFHCLIDNSEYLRSVEEDDSIDSIPIISHNFPFSFHFLLELGSK